MASIVTYEAPGHPLVTVVDFGDGRLGVIVGSTNEDASQSFPTSIAGLAVTREPNDEEQALGITSLNPPAGVTSLGEQRLIEIAMRATLAALADTLEIDAVGAMSVGQKLGHAVRAAVAKLELGEETTQTFGSVFAGELR